VARLKIPFETFPHTADLGLRARGKTLSALFRNAAKGLSAEFVSPRSVKPRVEKTVALSAAALDDLYLDWLNEIHFLFDADGFLTKNISVTVVKPESPDAPWRLHAKIAGENFSEKRHRLRRNIKAVTGHALKVKRTRDGWVGEVIVDV
jgi:SHS2 domain-containing protein